MNCWTAWRVVPSFQSANGVNQTCLSLGYTWGVDDYSLNLHWTYRILPDRTTKAVGKKRLLIQVLVMVLPW